MNRSRIALLTACLALIGGGVAGLVQPALSSNGQVRTAPVAGTSGSDYTISIGNRYSSASVATFSRTLFELTNGDPSTRLARFRVSFAASAASTSVPYRIWLVERGYGQTADYEYQLLGAGTFTTRASGTGVATTSVITSSEYPADTLTFIPATPATSPSGIYTALASAYLTNYTVYAPGSLVPATLFISDAGNYRYVVVDFDPGNGVNAVAVITPGT